MLLTSSLKTKAIQRTIQMNDLHHAEILKYYRRIIKILLTGRNKKNYGNAKATYASPESIFALPPPPQATTTYCLPFTSYTVGVAKPAVGNCIYHNNAPVRLLKALNIPSLIAAINSKPPAVTICL